MIIKIGLLSSKVLAKFGKKMPLITLLLFIGLSDCCLNILSLITKKSAEGYKILQLDWIYQEFTSRSKDKFYSSNSSLFYQTLSG